MKIELRDPEPSPDTPFKHIQIEFFFKIELLSVYHLPITCPQYSIAFRIYYSNVCIYAQDPPSIYDRFMSL
jgi:hypothetical protein